MHHCTHVFFSHTAPEAARLSQFPQSGSTSFPPPRLVLTLNHKPRCKVAGTVAVSEGPTDHSPRPTRGRGSWPSRLCWRARRRWGRKPGSRNPARGCWRGSVLSSSRLLYTPRSNRRSSCSLSRPDTRTGSCHRSRARTGSCPWASWAEGCDPCWKMSRPVRDDRESLATLIRHGRSAKLWNGGHGATLWSTVPDASRVLANVSSSIPLFIGFEEVYTPTTPTKLITRDSVTFAKQIRQSEQPIMDDCRLEVKAVQVWIFLKQKYHYFWITKEK